MSKKEETVTEKKPSYKKWIVPGIIVLVILIIVGTIWGSYNSLVSLDQGVKNSWANVETQYQRRFDLIPNLVNVVETYAKYEKDTLTKITELRSQWQTAKDVNERVQTANQIESTLSKLLLIAENYPDLKANQKFLSLQDSLAETENMVAVARTRYNGAVKEYNSAVRYFPSNIIAGWFGFSVSGYYESEDVAKTAPKLNMSIG